jgi:molybdenum cofactor sulfurtransferase
LLANNPGSDAAAYPSLFAYTGQSNITNTKNPLSTLSYASSLGYYTLLDAAALAPTSIISLTATPVDAMVVSFYKMFGFPTGVGALIIKESFLRVLQRPWFAGGNVDIVQVPGTIVTRAEVPYQQFEVCSLELRVIMALTTEIPGRHDQLPEPTIRDAWPPIPLRVPSFPPPPPLVSATFPSNVTCAIAT